MANENKLSFSSVQKYLQCPEAWYIYYRLKLREKTIGSALPFGVAVDAGINQLLENHKNRNIPQSVLDPTGPFLKLMEYQKINGVETHLSSTNLVKYSNTDFDADILTKDEVSMVREITKASSLGDYHSKLIDLKRNKNLTGTFLSHFNYMSWLSLRRKGLLMIDAYEQQVIPNIEEVLDIQKFFSLKNNEGDEFVGFIDYICRYKGVPGIVIKDNKTSGTPYKPDQARTSKQLASYFGALTEINYTNEPLSVGFDVMNKVIRKKKLPLVNIQVIIDKVDQKLVDLSFEEYDMVNNNIHAGRFESNHPKCSQNNYGNKCLCQLKDEDLVDVNKVEK